jgi:hypothetical protein
MAPDFAAFTGRLKTPALPGLCHHCNGCTAAAVRVMVELSSSPPRRAKKAGAARDD